jgi:hypothetical protein
MISILEKQRTESRPVLLSGTAEGGSQKWGITAVPDWWTAVPKGERALLHAIARMLRSAKRSQLPEVARAAAKWERGIGCFIKVRLIGEKQKESRKQKWRMGTDRDRSPVAATRTPVER